VSFRVLKEVNCKTKGENGKKRKLILQIFPIKSLLLWGTPKSPTECEAKQAFIVWSENTLQAFAEPLSRTLPYATP
jgi:hypothetical protein